MSKSKRKTAPVGPDAFAELPSEKKKAFKAMARSLVQGSIIEDAATQFMAQCLAYAVAETEEKHQQKWIRIADNPPPTDIRTMFVVIAINVTDGPTSNYTSDPVTTWHTSMENGPFPRWMHKFPPTHWMPLPDPKESEPA